MRDISRGRWATAAVVAGALALGFMASVRESRSTRGRAETTTSIPTPERFFGFPIGGERKIASLEKVYEYFTLIDKASDRVVVQEYGKSAMGKPMLLAVVSAPDTIAHLSRYQEMQRKLADPRVTSEEEAAHIVRDSKAILLVETAQHSNEVSSHLMAIKLIHKLATESSPWIEHVLNNVIILMIPIGNPDGHQLIFDWYTKNFGTPYEGSPLPEMWHKYIGHDNNRENYMQTQAETQHLNRLLFKDWLPDVYVNVHNAVPKNFRIFVPPYDAINPNIDPLIWSELNFYGQAMAAKLHEAGKVGVMWGEGYTAFQEGTNMRAPLWRNAIGILTETAAAPWGITTEQEMAGSGKSFGGAVAAAQSAGSREVARSVIRMPAPTDVDARMHYPRPWMGGTWTLADAIDYQFTATIGAIEAVANNRETRKHNFYLLNKRTIDRFRGGSPYAFVVPPDQRDPVAAAKLLQTIQAGGAEVHRATDVFGTDGVQYPAGTYVVLLAQPFGRWVKNLLEVQRWPKHDYPSIRAGGRGVAWTLGMLMGVHTVQIEKPFQAALAKVGKDVEAPPGNIVGNGATYVLDHAVNNSVAAMNRLLKEGADVSWARDELRVGGKTYAPGAILVTRAKPETMTKIARELKLDIQSTSQAVPSTTALRIRAPRIAVYEPWSGGNAESAIDAGWTRWVLEQHEFPYTHARNADLRKPGLLDRFDVIVLPEIGAEELVEGRRRPSGIDAPPPAMQLKSQPGQGSPVGNIRPEYSGGIGEEGVQNLRKFVRSGGTLITLGDAARFAIERLGLPFRSALRQSTADPTRQPANLQAFWCPGSIVRLAVDTHHPIGYGMQAEADAMFVSNESYLPAASSERTVVIAHYPDGVVLRSGILVGEDKLRGTGAVLEAMIGQGRVIMHTFRVQYRAQTLGTFKLLFNSIFYGPAMTGRSASSAAEPN